MDAAIPLIIDTDIGDDIDDTWALAMALGCRELDLRLIVTSAGDTAVRSRLTAKILDEMGRADIPIGTGIVTGDWAIHQTGWLGDYSLDAYPGTVREDGIQAMVDVIKASPDPVTILAIGPQTNLRAALDLDPSIAGNARVVTMAGAVECGYFGAEEVVPEYNIWRDIESAKAVFAAPWEIVMAPLDVCGKLALKGERYARVEASEHPRAAVTIANFRKWDEYEKIKQGASSVLFDTVAVYLAMDQALCRMKTLNLSIDEYGKTVSDENGRPVQCAMGWLDREAFEELLVTRLTVDEH